MRKISQYLWDHLITSHSSSQNQQKLRISGLPQNRRCLNIYCCYVTHIYVIIIGPSLPASCQYIIIA